MKLNFGFDFRSILDHFNNSESDLQGPNYYFCGLLFPEMRQFLAHLTLQTPPAELKVPHPQIDTHDNISIDHTKSKFDTHKKLLTCQGLTRFTKDNITKLDAFWCIFC